MNGSPRTEFEIASFGYQYKATNRADKDQAESVFSSCLADTEPDGWGHQVIPRDHAKQRLESHPGLGPLSDMDNLLWVSDFWGRVTGATPLVR